MNRLFHMPLSPFCRKVRLCLAEKRIEVELIEERYWERAPEFLRRNPAGKVPILKIDGHMMSESQAICEYLEEQTPTPPLLPETPDARYEVRRLVGWFDDKFHEEVTSKVMFGRVLCKLRGQHPDGRHLKSALKQGAAHLDYMGWLLDHRRWLAGDTMSLADFTAAAHLSCLDYTCDVDWDRQPSVKDWYATLKSRPSFRTLLADQVPGFPPPIHYANLDF